jgi:AAA15 family ATPase/GTPase
MLEKNYERCLIAPSRLFWKKTSEKPARKDGKPMIIDFTIKNFRSLKDEQLLSLSVENPKSHLLENISYPSNDKVGVLKTAGLYGANASGKSNVLLAFAALQWLIVDSGDLKEGEKIPCYEPYLLSDQTKGAPTSFEIEFASGGLRYLYAVTYNRQEILQESLDFYPSRQKANIFKREEGDTWETISFGGLYKGGTKKIPFFSNNTYLSKAGNNAAAADMIRSIYKYFRSISHIGSGQKVKMLNLFEHESLLKIISDLLCSVDTGVKSVSKRENKNNLLPHLPPGIPEEVKQAFIDDNKYTFVFAHEKEEGGVVLFKESKESDGTQKLFNLLPILLGGFLNGNIMIMDELDNSFHPHIAELLIKLFNDPLINKKNAQLIFSTHNINLMTPNLFRRDQIWFADKTNGATSIYSLDEFDKSDVKSSSPFGHWYDEGRFGALPQIDYAKISEIFKEVEKHEIEIDRAPRPKHSKGAQ